MLISQELKAFLDEQIKEHNDESKITVFPIPCGYGKSEYVKHRIIEKIQNSVGMIVVTDSIERMDGYMSSHDDELSSLLAENQNRISVLTATNMAEIMPVQSRRPILVMSTQRYFRLSRKEIQDLLKWKGGHRKEIIFDEKPYIIEQKKITIKTFTDIDAVLQMAIDDESDQEEKAWVVREWETLKEHIQNQITEYEKSCESQQMYLLHRDVWNQMTTDDKRFFKFVDKYRKSIESKNIDAYINIMLVRELFSDRAWFYCRKAKSGEYDNSFYVPVDNRDKLVDIGAKVYVFDGTATYSNEYDVDEVEVIEECEKFRPRLNRLTINCIDVSSSKRVFNNKGSQQKIKAINRYIKNNIDTSDAVLFTYKEIEDKFDSVEVKQHFGNIKGRNEYRNKHTIIQVGLNRFPPLYYFILSLCVETDSVGYEILKRTPTEKVKKYVSDVLSGNTLFDNSTEMSLSVLEDIEQNLYRSDLRNYDSSEKITLNLFFNTTEHEELITWIKWRFERVGATINIVETPDELLEVKTENRNTKNETIAQKVLRFFNSLEPGTTVKVEQILDGCRITQEQFKNAKKNKVVRRKLDKMKIGMPQGYYRA